MSSPKVKSGLLYLHVLQLLGQRLGAVKMATQKQRCAAVKLLGFFFFCCSWWADGLH